MTRIYERMPLRERFFSKVKKTDGCWLWTASVNNKGYGQFFWQRDPRIVRLAHRVSWEIAHGRITDGMHVLHRCDVPLCVRPSHLFLGDQATNMKDCVDKGRQVPYRKLSAEQVRAIRAAATGKRGDAGRIAKQFGIGRENVGCILRGKTWKHLRIKDPAA